MVLEWDKTVSNPVVVNEKISFPKFDFIKASHRDCAAAYASTGMLPEEIKPGDVEKHKFHTLWICLYSCDLNPDA